MASSKSPGPTTGQISYQDFDPEFEWSREEGSDTLRIHLPGSDTLRIHLPGFKKDNLRVELDGYGSLMTSGEQPLDSSSRRRFKKEFRIPEDCTVDDIHAKFENGVLYVILPKMKTTRQADHPQDRPPVATATTEPQREPEPRPAVEPQHDIGKKAGAMGETAAKQSEGKSSESVGTAQKDAGKIVKNETDGIARPAGSGKVVDDVKADEAIDKGIKQIDESRIEPKTEHGMSEGTAAGSEMETVRRDDGEPMLGLTKPMQPLLNVAGAILVLVCLAMYVAYKLGKAT